MLILTLWNLEFIGVEKRISKHHNMNCGRNINAISTGRNINNLRYADDTTLMAESEEELKSLLMKVK